MGIPIFEAMKVKFVCIGKTGKDFLLQGEQEYLNRLKHYVAIERVELPDLKNASKLSKEQIKEQEGKELLSKIQGADVLVLLDERGKELSSVQFADFIQQRFNSGAKNLVFFVGGAYGFSHEVYDRSNFKISLSKMTFSHQMVRLFFAEQFYRAFTIINGEKYHHV